MWKTVGAVTVDTAVKSDSNEKQQQYKAVWNRAAIVGQCGKMRGGRTR